MIIEYEGNDIYEPFEVKIKGKIYSLKFPLTTSLIQKFWDLAEKEEKAVEEKKIDCKTTDEIIKLMLKIDQKILNEVDHRWKLDTGKRMTMHLIEQEKKKTEPESASK